MTIDLPNVSVAVHNESPDKNWQMFYGGEEYNYPPNSITTVPFAVAHLHFGFEFDTKGKLYRNTATHYSDNEETQFYHTLASILPASLQVRLPDDTKEEHLRKKGEYQAMFDAYVNKISAKAIKTPRNLTKEQYDKMPS